MSRGLSFICHCVCQLQRPPSALSPPDALKYHFTSLKADLVFPKLEVLQNFHDTGLPIHRNFL